jgi:hypothetical protein
MRYPGCTGDRGIPRVKSNNRFAQSAGSYSYLARKWMAKIVLVCGLAYVLSTWEHHMPILLVELAKGKRTQVSVS